MADTLVYLCTFNGARFIHHQIQSIAKQTRDCSLVVSDDGSSDATLDLVRAHASCLPVQIVSGPRQGFARNFLSAFEHEAVLEHDWLAFADQDDLWDPCHLERAICAIRNVSGPAVYGARTRLIDERGQITGASLNRGCRLGFANALVQSFAGGNTLVLNREAIAWLRGLVIDSGPLVGWSSHDWAIYQLISCLGGSVVFDPEPTVSYRQHDQNCVGQNRSVGARLSRAMHLCTGKFKAALDAQAAQLARSEFRYRMTPESQEVFSTYAWARNRRGFSGVQALRDVYVRRESTLETRAFEVAFALNLT